MSQEAVEATARDYADSVTAGREDRELLTGILIRGAGPEVPAKSPAIRLLEDALFLRTNGERPPGHSEATWRKWEREAEVFLRSLLPPDPEGEETR
jgi:hypothetical protein